MITLHHLNNSRSQRILWLLEELGAPYEIKPYQRDSIRKHGGGKFAPAPGSKAHEAYLEWLHYAEGSAMLPLMINLYVMRLGEAGAPLKDRIDSEIDNNLGYIEKALAGHDYILAEGFTGADVQLSFVGEVARAFGRLGPFPNIAAWVGRLHDRPAFKASLEKGGVYNLA
jgi:glutathione S-transferase